MLPEPGVAITMPTREPFGTALTMSSAAAAPAVRLF